MKLEDHPTVQRIHLKTVPSVPPKKASLDAGWLKQLVLDAGADDVGFVEIDRPALDGQREDIFKALPRPEPPFPGACVLAVSGEKAASGHPRRAPKIYGRLPDN